MENLQDDFYQLENKQVKGAKLRASIRWELGGEKCSKSFINCINSFLINYFLSFQIFKTPGERFASWVLPIKQESYLSYLETNLKIAFTNIQPKVKIDGLLSDPFTLIRGVQQECPLHYYSRVVPCSYCLPHHLHARSKYIIAVKFMV